MKSMAGVLMALTLPGAVLAASPAPVEPPLEQRVLLLERKVQALTDLVLRLDALQQEVQQLRGEVEVQNHAMDALKQRQRDLYLDVDQRLGQLTGSGQATGTATEPGGGPGMQPSAEPDPVAGSASESPTGAAAAPGQGEAVVAVTQGSGYPAGDPQLEQETYQAAFDMLMQRRYGEARQAFQSFLASYPAGAYADNAQYWLGEANYVTRDFDVALVEFGKVIELYPASSKVPDAMLKSGFILYERQQWDMARNILERLLKEHPATTASRLGRQRLDKMRSEGH